MANHGVGDFFALDIGTNAVRVVQLSPAGGDTWNLTHFGYAPVDEKITSSSSPEAQRKLGEVIMTAVGQSGIKTKNVVIGLPSSKTFTTVIEVPLMSENELRSTIKYQVDQYIPMAVNEAKVDWALLGTSLHDPKMQEVIIASTANSYAEERLEFVESLGLNVIAAEPDPLAMIRSLLPAGVPDARLIIDMGEQATNLAITFGDTPRLVRTIPTGVQSLVKATVQNLNVQEDQAVSLFSSLVWRQIALRGRFTALSKRHSIASPPNLLNQSSSSKRGILIRQWGVSYSRGIVRLFLALASTLVQK